MSHFDIGTRGVRNNVCIDADNHGIDNVVIAQTPVYRVVCKLIVIMATTNMLQTRLNKFDCLCAKKRASACPMEGFVL